MLWRSPLTGVGGQLACRRCFGLAYQSQTHGRWHRERMAERTEHLAQKPGPKGRRYRACLRRHRRVEAQASEWIEKWTRRWEPWLREEGLDSPLDLGGFTRLVTP